MRLGDVVQAKVIEVVEDNSLILSFQGKLLRVLNQTGCKYKVDEKVRLQISRLQPLEFKLQKKFI